MSRFASYPSLRSRAVLITGGATGIGATLVEEFALQGALVAFVDIDRAAGEALCDAVTSAGSPHRPLFIETDVTDAASLQAAIQSVGDRLAPIAVLVNNAANDMRHSIEQTTPAAWDQGMAVNLKHHFFAAQQAALQMKAAGGGSIVNLGSISWMLKNGGMPVYLTAKAAVHGLTRALARDLGVHGIRVNTLVPGWVMTAKQKALWVGEASAQEIARGQCIDRPLLAEHIARMALFLASDDSEMCTAQDFIVDGGWA
jgi:D-xylose 1-dehydrogenase